MTLPIFGAGCFGFVIGWIIYRTLRRAATATALSDIATVIGAVGGAGITTLFKDENLFGGYSIGLGIGFIGYLIVARILDGKGSRRNGWGSLERMPA
jgi:drug/metabolite transporter (DMT)-like permease